MKKNKMIPLLFAAILSIALTACTKTDNTNRLPFEANLQKVGTFVVGTSPDYAPFESLNASGQLEGFDIDLMKALGEYIKSSNNESYQIDFVQMEFDTIVTALQGNQVDMGISSFTYDKDRDVLFSTPYLKSQQVVVVNPNSTIASLADLEGKKIAVQLGTTGEIAAADITGASLLSLDNVNIMFESLKNNAVDALVVDKAVADNYVSNAGFAKLEEPLIDEEVSIIIKKGNEELLKVIDDAIVAFKQTPAYQDLLEQWGVK